MLKVIPGGVSAGIALWENGNIVFL